VELLFQLEKEFGLRIDIEDLDLDDLRTLERIARLIADHAAAKARDPDDPAARVPT
jgi:acyl carrier protein